MTGRKECQQSPVPMLLAVLALLWGLVLVPQRACAEEASASDDTSGEQLIVTYAPGTPTLAESEEAGTGFDAFAVVDEEVVSEGSSDGAGPTTAVTVELADGVSLDDAIDLVAEDPAVVDVQRNFVYRLPTEHPDLDDVLSAQATINDTYRSSQYYLNPWGSFKFGANAYGANVFDAWDLAKANGSVTVAVLDTGCLATHEDLAANIDKTHMIDVANGTSAGRISDADGHGTHVCGIIGGVANNGKGIAGVSYNAKILPICVFDDDEGASTITITKALDYLINLIKTGELTDLRVINMSLCIYIEDEGDFDGYDRAVHSRIKTLRNTYNVLSVCAGGNGNDQNPLTTPCYPSDFAECLSVTALDSSGNNIPWSDYNAAKDISAPGETIFSTYGGSKTSYTTYSGTSMASPIVAGVASLLWAAVPDLTCSQVVTALRATAHKLSTTDANYHPTSGSAGAVDADAAVRYAIEHYGTRTSITGCSIVSVAAQTYTGSPIKPTPMVTLGGEPLEEGRDYAYSYRNNTKVGTATITVTGKGIYQGTATRTFTIKKADISKASSSELASRAYTGSAIRPRPVVTYKGKTLAQFTDYTLTYTNNVGLGTGWVHVTGKGNFSGVLDAPFTIAKSVTFENPFADVDGLTSHYADILWLAQQDISAGWVESDGTRTFRPNEAVKRGDMAAFLYRLADNWGLIADGWEPSAQTCAAFSDVSDDTSHAHEIWWLAQSGISVGWAQGSARVFRPNEAVKRGDMAAFMFRLAKLAQCGGASDAWVPTEAQLMTFDDVDALTAHQLEIVWLAGAGVSTGWQHGDGTASFRPNEATKRGDMAAFLHRLDVLA